MKIVISSSSDKDPIQNWHTGQGSVLYGSDMYQTGNDTRANHVILEVMLLLLSLEENKVKLSGWYNTAEFRKYNKF